MTSFLSAKKRAEEFADAVEAVLTLTTSGVPVRAQPAFEPLLDVVLGLRTAPAPTPRTDFTVALRQRLLAEAVSVLAPGGGPSPLGPVRPPDSSRHHHRGRGRAVVAASALVAIGGTAGVATAAQSALPGDTLYSVKRAIEGAQFTLSTSDSGRGRDLLGQATHRLEEIDGLLDSSDEPADVQEQLLLTIEAFESQAREGSVLMLGAYEEDGDEQVAADVRSFAAASMSTLAGLATDAPAAVRPELFEAARLVRDVDHDAAELCSCGDDELLRIPPGFGRPASDGDIDGAGGSEDGTAVTDELFPNAAPSGDAGTLAGPSAPVSPGATGLPSPSVGLPSDGVTPTGIPGPTDAPTDGPSGLPTDVPSEVPTEVPTDLPTEGPTDLPTEVPTDPATEVPSPDSPVTPSGEPSADASQDTGDSDTEDTDGEGDVDPEKPATDPSPSGSAG